MDFDLKDRVAVVTGASRGIGRAIAVALAAEGCHVACVATAEDRAAASAAEAEGLGVKARPYGCDVASFDAVKELADRVGRDVGPADILVNNAGVTRDGLVMRMSEDDWNRVLDVNLKGAFNTSRVFARTLRKSAAPRIINIASVAGIMGNAGQANYAASKGGLIAMTKSLARELASRQICVNAVAPGFIETDMTSGIEGDTREEARKAILFNRFGAPEDVARMVVFLAGSTGSYITGQTFVIDGGMAI